MSESFIETFAKSHRRSQKAFNDGDFERAFTGLSPNIEWHILPSILETGVLRGRDAVVRYFSSVRDGVDWRVEAQEFIDAGEGHVLICQRGSAAGRTTGISGTIDFFQLWDLGSDGLIVRVREYERREDALEAAGLPE